jgi:hypothetical protein
MNQSNAEQFVGENEFDTMSSLHSAQQCALVYLLEVMKADSEAAKNEKASQLDN